MTKGPWVMRNGELVEKYGPLDIRQSVARSALPRPMVISDTLADVVNPVNGRPYDSKSNYYRAVKAAGCEVLGNDTIPQRDRDIDTSDHVERAVAEAVQELS